MIGRRERTGGLEIDYKLKFARQFDREIGWLCPLEYLAHKLGGQAPISAQVYTVAHQTAFFDMLS